MTLLHMTILYAFIYYYGIILGLSYALYTYDMHDTLITRAVPHDVHSFTIMA